MSHFMRAFIVYALGLLLFANTLQAQNIDSKAEEILYFWFGAIQTPQDFPKEKIMLWFSKKEEIDRGIREKYEHLVLAAAKNELDGWQSTPRGRLALIILLDQFSRNIYREMGKAFSFEEKAAQLAVDGIEKEDDLQLLPIERAFFYFPLMHSENLKLQELSVAKYRALVIAAPQCFRSNYKSYEDFALRHYDIIAQFGRFPHRNRILQRLSTEEEVEFLKTPSASF